MTKTNKFSMIFEQTIWKLMKYRGAHLVPQFRSFSKHSGGVLEQSYITKFQSSPVDILKSMRKAFAKLEKFMKSFITWPEVMFLKKNTPSTANMKKTSINRLNTLNKDGREKVMVDIKAWSPSYFPTSLSILDTLSTLRTLAS